MKVLIIGATSAIAQETAKQFAKEGADLFLVGRNADKLMAVQQDLGVRGANSVGTYVVDLDQIAQHPSILEKSIEHLGHLDSVLVAHGTLSNQQACQNSVAETLKEIHTNISSVFSLLTHLANYFEDQKRGTIAVITSVAGDRGRQSNYVYGAAKGAQTIFLEGLRNRLTKSGVSVITIKPGFVDTPMTAHIKKTALFADSKAVGGKIYQTMKQPRDVLYVPWFWSPIMSLIRRIPEPLFKRLSL
jgi:short-subunit dehydrogenase